MNINEIVGRLKAGGLDASSTNRSAAVYVTEARSGRAKPGWFGFRIVCDSEATERRVRAILSRWYDIDASGNVWRLKSKNRVPLMAIKRGGVPPTPPTPTGDYMYFEAVQPNSTVSMMSTLATAPDLEYSTDGETWQEWQHTTAEGVHTFDTITLTNVGDKVYLRGYNPNGFATSDGTILSVFNLSGSIISGGKLVSLIDKTMNTVVLPDYSFTYLFMCNDNFSSSALLTPPSLEGIKEIGVGSLRGAFSGQGITSPSNMDDVETIKAGGCNDMYQDCISLISASDLPSINLIGSDGCRSMYSGCTSLTAAADIQSTVTLSGYACSDMYKNCTFDMSNDGTTLNFDFPTPPVTTIGDYTYSTAYDVAEWMGNTNGFSNP